MSQMDSPQIVIEATSNIFNDVSKPRGRGQARIKQPNKTFGRHKSLLNLQPLAKDKGKSMGNDLILDGAVIKETLDDSQVDFKASKNNGRGQWWDRLQSKLDRDKDIEKYVKKPESLAKSPTRRNSTSPFKQTLTQNIKRRDKLSALLKKEGNPSKSQRMEKQEELLKKFQMEKTKRDEMELLNKEGIQRSSKSQIDEKIAQTVISEQKEERQKQIKAIYEQNRKKFRKDLDNINSDVMQKQQLLAKLRCDLQQVAAITQRQSKIDQLVDKQKEEHDVVLEKKYKRKDGSRPAGVNGIPRIPIAQLNQDLQGPESASNRQSEQRCSMSQRPRANSGNLKMQSMRPLSANNRSLNVDEGISGSLYKPTALLARKKLLYDKLALSKKNYELENLDRNSYKYMLSRLQGQQDFETAMIRELDPYFNFQAKIVSTLDSISQGKEARIKIQDQKIRQIKNQMREKKALMSQNLRIKCLELVELERENKQQKSKMLGGGQAAGGSSTKDTKSVGGTTNQTLDFGKTKTENQSFMNQQSPRNISPLASIREEPIETGRKIEISLETFQQYYEYIEMAETAKLLYIAQKKLVLDQTWQWKSGRLGRQLGEEMVKVTYSQVLRDLRSVIQKKAMNHRKQQEIQIELAIHLSQKPPKSIVSFAEKQRGSKEHLSHAAQGKLDKVNKWHERQQEAKEMFYEIKEQLESIMLPNVNEEYENNMLLDKHDKAYDLNGQNLDIIDEDSSNKNEYDSSSNQVSESQKGSAVNLEINTVNFEKLNNGDKPSNRFKKADVPALDLKKSSTRSANLKLHKDDEYAQKSEHLNIKLSRPVQSTYEIFVEIVKNKEQMITHYNNRIVHDTIMQVDYNDRNLNKVKLQNELNQLKKELKQLKVDQAMNDRYALKQVNIPYDQQNTERKNEIRENQLLTKIIQKKRVGDQSGQITGDEDADKVIRKVLTANEILSKHVINEYDVAYMCNDHRQFQILTKEIRGIQEKIRFMCNEFINTFAYRINLIIEAADIDFQDAEIEKIIKIYQRNWPYEPLNYEAVQDDLNLQQQAGSSDMLLKNLAKFEDNSNLKTKQKKKNEQKAKRKQIAEGLNDFQIQMRQSAVWHAFAEKIERGLLFLHLRKFIGFLTKQIKVLRRPQITQSNISAAGKIKKPKKINPVRKSPTGEHFELEYKTFLNTNQQNLAQIHNMNRVNTETPQEQVQLQQAIILEQIHFNDVYKKNHLLHNAKKNKNYLQMQRIRSNFNTTANLFQGKQSGIEKILRQVNQDKCNYSRLKSFEIQDVDFIQQFVKKANMVQETEILALPEQNDDKKKDIQRPNSFQARASPFKNKIPPSTQSAIKPILKKGMGSSSAKSLKRPPAVPQSRNLQSAIQSTRKNHSKYQSQDTSIASKSQGASGIKTFTTINFKGQSTSSQKYEHQEINKDLEIPGPGKKMKKRPPSSYDQIEAKLKERTSALQAFYRNTNSENQAIAVKLKPNRSQQNFIINKLKRNDSGVQRSSGYMKIKNEAIQNLESSRSGMVNHNSDLGSQRMPYTQGDSQTWQEPLEKIMKVRDRKSKDWYFASSDEDVVGAQHLQWFTAQQAMLHENLNADFELSHDFSQTLLSERDEMAEELNEFTEPMFTTNRFGALNSKVNPKIKIKKVKLPNLQKNKTLNKLVKEL